MHCVCSEQRPLSKRAIETPALLSVEHEAVAAAKEGHRWRRHGHPPRAAPAGRSLSLSPTSDGDANGGWRQPGQRHGALPSPPGQSKARRGDLRSLSRRAPPTRAAPSVRPAPARWRRRGQKNACAAAIPTRAGGGVGHHRRSTGRERGRQGGGRERRGAHLDRLLPAGAGVALLGLVGRAAQAPTGGGGREGQQREETEGREHCFLFLQFICRA